MKRSRYIKFFGFLSCCSIVFILLTVLPVQAQQASSILFESDGRLTYISDQEGNRIPDFSHSGYWGGGVPIPYPPVRITLPPQTGDDTERIQKALRDVGQMPKDANGHRGAVLLKPGIYEINDNITLGWDGVVLRGSGSGSDPSENTILKVSKQVRGTVLTIGNTEASWYRDEMGTNSEIISEFVPVGSRNFEVKDPDFYEVGDNIILRHHSSQEWLDAINGGGTASAPPWEPGYIEIYYNRVVTGKLGNTISIDVPIYNHFDRSLATTRVYKVLRDQIVTEVGVEYLRIEISTSGPDSEEHADNAVMFEGVENGWARHVTTMHFSVSGFGTRNSKNITVRDSKALEPHSTLTGERRYNFQASLFSNSILFENVTSSNARRSFVSNGTSVASGIVFLNSRSIGALNASEGHQRWSQGLLYDNITFENPQTYLVLGLYNRGDIGTSHGWGAVHSVAWNVDSGGQYIYIQKPPTAQNYGIGNKGTVNGDGLFHHPTGFIERTNSDAFPQSLYEAQLEERLQYGVPPDAPARLTVSNEEVNQLSLSWLHSSVKDTRFIVERSNDGGVTFDQIDISEDNDSSYTDKTVAEYVYHYRVRAEDSNGKSAYSNVASAEPFFNHGYIGDFLVTTPEDSSQFSIETDPDELLTFSWDQPETLLDIEYTWMLDRSSGDFSNPIASISAGNLNEISTSYREIINILGDASITFDSDLPMMWTVKANSKTIEKQASNVYHLTFIKRKGSDILDEPEPGSDPEPIFPEQTELRQNYPNPFNPVTTIRFYLSEESNVTLEIFDMSGTRVAIIDRGMRERGYHVVRFNASNLASGVYIYRLKTKNLETTRKMTLVK